jgi:magnesium transporter
MSKNNKNKKRKIGLPPETMVYTGDREDKPSLTRTVSYDTEGIEVLEQFAPEREAAGKRLWVDVRNISDVAYVKTVGERFKIHPLAQEDVVNTSQRAKMDEYDNGLFVVLPNVQFDKKWSELRFEQIALFVGQNLLVSFQEDPDDTLKILEQRLQESNGRMRKKGIDYLAYSIIDTIVDNYFIALDEIETIIFDMENSVYNHEILPHFKSKIFNLKHVLNQFKQRVQPLREALSKMHRTDCPYLGDNDLLYLRDVTDHVVQSLDQIDSYKDQLTNLESLYQSEVNNRMNNVMKLLTVISTIFIPLSFVAGIYGMNFDNMPETHWHYGYFIVLGLMFSSAVGMLIWFRLKKWI